MAKIPILDLKKQIAPIRAEIDEAIKKVIDNTGFILGSEVAELEDACAKYCKAGHAVGVSNGTDAIKLAIIAAGIGPGEGVICPSFTYFATAGAIVSMGGVPVFADIDPQTYTLTAEEIEKALQKAKGLKVKAVIPVHLYGQCCDMNNIMKVAGKYNLKVVEDTAQAFGAECKFAGIWKKAGTIGDCGTVSFFPGKNIGAFGDAGMVLTNAKDTADKIKVLRNQGNVERYYHEVIGYNNRMDTIQAAVLKVKLKYLDGWNKKRQDNAAYYNEQFKGLKIRTPFVAPYSTHIYHQYVLDFDQPSDKLAKHLSGKGIDARVYYPVPLHLQKCFGYLGYKKGDFPVSERSSTNTLAIPVYPDLTRQDLDYVAGSIKEFLI